MRDLVDRMLAMVDGQAWTIDSSEDAFRVTIAGDRIGFDIAAPGMSVAFEELAEAVASTIAMERARKMMEAAGVAAHPVPLWLISGSDILAKWLGWAGGGTALRKALSLTDAVGLAPVGGYLDRRARREVGQGGARIRVRGGMAVAERIELSDHPRCVATLGERALIRIEAHRLPDTMIAGLRRRAGSNERRPLADVVSHPFVAAAELTIAGVVQDGEAAVFALDHHWAPLETVPEAARSVLPPYADPVFPWRATISERRRLDALVDEARHRAAARRGPH